MKIAKIIMDSSVYSMCGMCSGRGKVMWDGSPYDLYDGDPRDLVICRLCQGTGKTRTICVVAEVEVPWNYTLENATND